MHDALAIGARDRDPAGFEIETDSGIVARPIRRDAAGDRPSAGHATSGSRLPFRRQLGEQRIGFALVGVPHLVILCDDVATVDVVGRGRPLRSIRRWRTGANVNFVSPHRADGRWRIRTYERGVEAETLACGSGSVATAILLTEWGERGRFGSGPGRAVLTVRLTRPRSGWLPSLSGEARMVFQGRFGEL